MRWGMEKTKLEKLARLSGKATSKALDALGKHGFDIRGKLSARSTECPVGLLLQSRNRASDGQSRAGKFGEQRRRDNRSGNLVLPPFSARRSAQTLRIARDLDWPTGLG